MPVDLTKSGIAVAVGLADEGLEWWDREEKRTKTFQNASDIGRLIGAILGYGIQVLVPRYARYGEALALGSTPLLVKSIAVPVKAAMTAPKKEQVFVPVRRKALPPPDTRTDFRRSYIPEFENVQQW